MYSLLLMFEEPENSLKKEIFHRPFSSLAQTVDWLHMKNVDQYRNM